MLLLCYFIVRLFQVLAGGSRYPREADEFGTVFVFLFEKGMRTGERVQIRARPGSILRVEGASRHREIMVQFPQVSHDLIAIHYLYSMPRGYRSRHRDTHEIMLSVSVSVFRGLSSGYTQHYTELCTRHNMRMD